MNSSSPSDYSLPVGSNLAEGQLVKVLHSTFDDLVAQDTRVFKTGNSLAIRIPSAIAKRLDLDDGAPIQMAVEDGVIFVRKAPSQELTDLIDRITPENMHEPTFENLIGAERW